MLTYAIILLVVGILLAVMEALVPSGGILGILAAGAIIASLVLAFKESSATGGTFLILTVILIPVFMIFSLKIFPKTPIGRRVILKPSVETADQRGAAGVADKDYSHLMGKTGTTTTPLRPSGIAEINDQRYSVVAEGEMIDKGIDIVVVKIEGNSIVVEPKNA